MTDDADPPSAWVRASPGDAGAVLALMREFYAEEHLVYEEGVASRAVHTLLADPGVGAVFLFCDSGNLAHGYFVATLAFSLEFGGRYALLDELYLRASARGRGAGKSALAAVEKWAASCHATTVRLEVNHHNEKARTLYLKSGFRDDRRHILSREIRDGSVNNS